MSVESVDTHLQQALTHLDRAKASLASASQDAKSSQDEPRKGQAYDLGLMSDEAFDISDRLLRIMRILGVEPTRPGG